MPREIVNVDLSHPQFSGYLTKRSSWLKEWRRRYFVLKGDKLYFAKNVNVPPHGVIDLSQCQTVKGADDQTHKKHSIEVATSKESFYMYAESEKDKNEWIGAIGRALVNRIPSLSESE
ncbi:hypothetical protein WA556_005588 [Blastocystis sp. ATCC 50177/Nand II]